MLKARSDKKDHSSPLHGVHAIKEPTLFYCWTVFIKTLGNRVFICYSSRRRMLHSSPLPPPPTQPHFINHPRFHLGPRLTRRKVFGQANVGIFLVLIVWRCFRFDCDHLIDIHKVSTKVCVKGRNLTLLFDNNLTKHIYFIGDSSTQVLNGIEIVLSVHVPVLGMQAIRMQDYFLSAYG